MKNSMPPPSSKPKPKAAKKSSSSKKPATPPKLTSSASTSEPTHQSTASIDDLLSLASDYITASSDALSLNRFSSIIAYNELSHTLLIKLGKLIDNSYVVLNNSDLLESEVSNMLEVERIQKEEEERVSKEVEKNIDPLIKGIVSESGEGVDNDAMAEFLKKAARDFILSQAAAAATAGGGNGGSSSSSSSTTTNTNTTTAAAAATNNNNNNSDSQRGSLTEKEGRLAIGGSRGDNGTNNGGKRPHDDGFLDGKKQKK